MSWQKTDRIFSLLLYAVIFSFFLLIYKPSLLYAQFQPAFYFDRHFLHAFMRYPGGFTDALSLFILQFFFNDIIGSLLFAAILLAIFLFLRAILRRFAEATPTLFLMLPISFLIMLYNQYNIPLAVAVKFAIVLFCAYLYAKGQTTTRVLFLCAQPILYWMFGGWFSLFFVLVVLFIHLFYPWPTFLFPLLFAVLYGVSAFLSARFLFQISLKEAFLYVLPAQYHLAPFLFKSDFLFYLPFISVSLLLVLLRVFMLCKKRKSDFRRKKGVQLIDRFAAMVVLCACLLLSIQTDQKRMLHINCLAQRGEWESLLLEAKRLRAYDRIVEFQCNRAMYFTGCLLDSLFEIEHPVGVNGLFVDRLMASQIALHASDLYFDLAYINAAQVMAYEYMTKFRYDARALKRLALTNAINGHPHKTEKFLKLLEKSLVHRRWAREHRLLLDEGRIDEIPGIAEKRRLMPRADFFLSSQNPSADMIALLEANGGNRMAFEYMMASHLLECRLGNIAKHIGMLKKFDYRVVPRHIEEAAIMYQTSVAQVGGEFIRNIPFRRDRIAQFGRFNKIIADNKMNQRRADQLLRAELGDTFWYYLYSGGGERTDILKKRKIESEY